MTLTFAGFNMSMDGYGYGTLKIATALQRLLPQQVEILDLGLPRWDATQPGWETHTPTVALCMPGWLPRINTHGQSIVAFTMFEASKLPAGWVELLNQHAQAVLVPCVWNQEVFRANGVQVPIHVVKWGIDINDYWPLQRQHTGRPYTFLWSGTPDKRKGWDLVYRAFRRAFGDDPNVQLVMHFRKLPDGLNGTRDKNVRIVAGMVERPVQRQMLQDADCFVFPSRGEGWGLPPREAAATGLPTIVTDFGGLAEDIAMWGITLRVKGTSRAEYGDLEWGDIGEWVEPDEDHLLVLLRTCYEHQVWGRARGLRAAQFLTQVTTWDATAQRLVEVLRENQLYRP